MHEGKGSLRVISTPLRCTVRFAGMTREKTQPKLNMTLIPAGGCSIAISIPGQELSEKIQIPNRQRTIVMVDFSDKDELPSFPTYLSETAAVAFRNGLA
jgi:hypothetical protein